MRIDLLVTDVGFLSSLNERQMADAGSLECPALKVLCATGYAENAFLGNGHLAPDMRALTEPFVLDTLITKVRELVIACGERKSLS